MKHALNARRLLTAVAALLLSGGMASATPIIGYSTGSLSDGVNTTQDFTWGAVPSHLKVLVDPSDGNFDISLEPGVQGNLAGLTWIDTGNNKLQKTLSWLVNIHLDPSGDGTKTLSLEIKASEGLNGNDSIIFEDLSGVVLTLPGFTVRNLELSSENFNTRTRTWQMKPGTDTLYLLGEIAVVPPDPDPDPVPEPASMVLLGTGLVGIATALRRRR